MAIKKIKNKILIPKKDPCKIEKKEIKNFKREKKSFPNVKNNIFIPKVVSMWKNPKSEIIPIEERLKTVKTTKVEINVKKLFEFNKALDSIEKWCEERKNNKLL